MSVAEVVSEVEAAGVALQLEGEKIRVRYPDQERREELAWQIALLRDQRAEVAAYLKARNAIPPMPEGIRLIRWEPKQAPVILTQWAVVSDVLRFVQMTMLELRVALAGKRTLAGNHSVRELIDRLEQCGVIVGILSHDERGEEQITPDATCL